MIAPTIGTYTPVMADVFLLPGEAIGSGEIQSYDAVIRDPACEQHGLSAGDWNGDGASDLAVFASGTESTWARIWYGPFVAPRNCAQADVTIQQPASARAGVAWGGDSLAGDLDGDGLDELLATTADSPNSASPWAETTHLVVVDAGDLGVVNPDDASVSIVGLGLQAEGRILPDRGGDGYADLVGYQSVSATEDRVLVWARVTDSSATVESAALSLTLGGRGGRVADGGAMLGSEGETLLIGGPFWGADASEVGHVCALAANRSGSLTVDDCDLHIVGSEAESYLGYSLDYVPDVDGAGSGLLLAGAPYDDDGNASGTVLGWARLQ